LAIRRLGIEPYFDNHSPAFEIRIGKNRKTWLVVKGKNRTKATIGHYPALSLKDAHKRALVELGNSFEPRIARSFPDARDAFIAQDGWGIATPY
jgi:hypothetical protein